MVKSTVESVDVSGDKCKVTIKTPKGEEIHEADIVLSAVGISPNLQNIGIEDLDIEYSNMRFKLEAASKLPLKFPFSTVGCFG